MQDNQRVEESKLQLCEDPSCRQEAALKHLTELLAEVSCAPNM